MSKPKLPIRDEAILRHVWILNHTEKQGMDRFFLLHDTWNGIEQDLIPNEDHAGLLLQHERQEYEVVLLDSISKLRSSEDIGLSFRCNYASGLKIVLLKAWNEPVRNSPPQRNSEFTEL